MGFVFVCVCVSMAEWGNVFSAFISGAGKSECPAKYVDRSRGSSDSGKWWERNSGISSWLILKYQ